ncbi:hypothetical protein CBR_g23871 [Chara braunii]|uniref:Uncharacterized protein n=1 Tax=Chara braunii TaxID=69332 RepID=A0A388L5A1_CHABU|nr:hypothetical protein CBR_g23871 [Chara braunii]|eukprot:GBG77422.1 hypothetical protein CBR_g23871 [Chara braunii]
MIISGLAGLVAGACSMGIGEYVSVHSQRDTEKADLEKERIEHEKGPESRARELEELTQIYVQRGLKYDLAKEVAEELTKHDYLRAHARDELGIDLDDLANPFQAAFASVVAFVLAGLIPLISCAFVQDHNTRLGVVIAVATISLFVSGAIGARLGGASIWRPAIRVTVGGWAAMLVTFGILRAFGTAGL